MDGNAKRLFDLIPTILQPFDVANDAAERVYAAYTEPWRTYHNAAHILQMWELAQDLPMDDATRQNLGLLIIYHDVWYKIGREPGENEKRSASWAAGDICVPTADAAPRAAKIIQMLRHGIMATIDHTIGHVAPPYIKETVLLLDLDLQGLGQSPERFAENTEAVWHEFEPMITREQFDKGRAEWARKFLGRDAIYHTKHFSHLEDQARTNLAALAAP